MRRISLNLVAGCTLASLSSTPVLAQTATDTGQRAASSLEEVVVTARRKEERAQSTPISVAAFSAEDIRQQGITQVRDLTAAVPGVNLTQSGGSNNTVFSIRGLSRGAVGNAQPAVTTYVNDVPLSTWGASIPTYDIAQVQVLKGPQGTLFGRNSVTGAVLVNTQRPVFDLEGYVDIVAGNYDWQKYEAVLNVPVVTDKLAIRIAGQLDKRDGYTKNLSFPGRDMDDKDARNVRVSVLFEPMERLSNLTVYERNEMDEHGTGIVPYQSTGPGAADQVCLGAQFGAFGSLSSAFLPYCNIERYLTSDKRELTTDLAPFLHTKLNSLSNTTTFDIGPLTLKNIFGYRSVFTDNSANTDGLDLPMINAHSLVDLEQYTDEFQVSGSALQDNLTYIAGLFYLEQKPNGKQRLGIQVFNPAGTPFELGATGNGDYYHDTSKAVFGQITYKLAAISDALARWSIDAGARYTKDKERVCDAPFQPEANEPISESECPTAPNASTASTEFNKATYTFGVNYQASDDVLLYAVTRTGYRAGGLNTPELGGTLVQFQSFEPETVQDLELGMKSDWNIADMRGRFNLALFQAKYENLQAGILTGGLPDPDADGNPANNPSNNTFYAGVGKATTKGIEAELQLVPFDALQLSFGGAVLDKKIDDLTVQLPSTLAGVVPTKEGIGALAFMGAPKYSYNAAAQYTLPIPSTAGEVTASVRYFRISEVDYGSVEAPVGDKLDFRIDWNNVMSSDFDVSAFVTNAQDRTYPIASASSNEGLNINSAIYNEPRIYGAQLRYRFGQ